MDYDFVPWSFCRDLLKSALERSKELKKRYKEELKMDYVGAQVIRQEAEICHSKGRLVANGRSRFPLP